MESACSTMVYDANNGGRFFSLRRLATPCSKHLLCSTTPEAALDIPALHVCFSLAREGLILPDTAGH